MSDVRTSPRLAAASKTGRRRLVAVALGAAPVLSVSLGLTALWADQTVARAAAPANASDRSNDVSPSTGFPRRYEATYHEDHALEHAGVLSMAADGKLAIVQADDRFAEMLDTIVRNMNAMPHETARVPPEADQPRYSLHSRVIPRTSAEFIPTMLANIRRGYRLELRAADAP